VVVRQRPLPGTPLSDITRAELWLGRTPPAPIAATEAAALNHQGDPRP
jgi:hypothetical protein